MQVVFNKQETINLLQKTLENLGVLNSTINSASMVGGVLTVVTINNKLIAEVTDENQEIKEDKKVAAIVVEKEELDDSSPFDVYPVEVEQVPTEVVKPNIFKGK